MGTTRLNKHILAPQGCARVDTGTPIDVVFVDSTSLTIVVPAVTGPINVEDKSKLLTVALNGEDGFDKMLEGGDKYDSLEIDEGATLVIDDEVTDSDDGDWDSDCDTASVDDVAGISCVLGAELEGDRDGDCEASSDDFDDAGDKASVLGTELDVL